jgi:hypothetical protein
MNKFDRGTVGRKQRLGLLTTFNRVELLLSSSEMKTLPYISIAPRKSLNFSIGRRIGIARGNESNCSSNICVGSRRTSVSIANSGFHESGGMILQIPYFDASGEIFFMYSNGSLNSSSVGLYVGASSRP